MHEQSLGRPMTRLQKDPRGGRSGPYTVACVVVDPTSSERRDGVGERDAAQRLDSDLSAVSDAGNCPKGDPCVELWAANQYVPGMPGSTAGRVPSSG